MQGKKLTGIVLCFFCISLSLRAQESISFAEADAKSYELYQQNNWRALLDYGNAYTSTAPDFLLLRLRMGYAAYMLNNFSEALKQYDAALVKDSYNETAHYYSWLCRRYLNQPEQADAHLKYFSKEALQKEKQKNLALTKVALEFSYKSTPLFTRGNGLYARIDAGTRLHPNINMQHSIGLFNQTIEERKFTAVINNRNIAINQKEYYNKTIFNLNKNWQLIGAYHYLYTPFNNFMYNNHIGLAGAKYNGTYFSVQADAIFGVLTDSSLQQYNVTVSLYPDGNLNFYGFSTVSLQNKSGRQSFNFKQVVGCKLMKDLWIEGNATLGSFSNFMENDALYVYNAIDRNNNKAGVGCYYSVQSNCTAQLGYTFEQRTLYQTTNTFTQHSITGGLSWKF